jgi:hypothetical protein
MKTAGMWEDTLMVWASDNGGDAAANNYPLRGAKFSNWEGGIHVGAFVSGGYLPVSRRGIKLGGLATCVTPVPEEFPEQCLLSHNLASASARFASSFFVSLSLHPLQLFRVFFFFCFSSSVFLIPSMCAVVCFAISHLVGCGTCTQLLGKRPG